MFKSMLPTKSVCLTHTCNTKWLTWKAGQQKIVLRDTIRFNLGYIARNLTIIAKIRLINAAGI